LGLIFPQRLHRSFLFPDNIQSAPEVSSFEDLKDRGLRKSGPIFHSVTPATPELLQLL
jgi:hypothetical protein